MNVALYGRVSSRDKGQDTENQLAQLRAFAATQRWTVFREYVDRATAYNPGAVSEALRGRLPA